MKLVHFIIGNLNAFLYYNGDEFVLASNVRVLVPNAMLVLTNADLSTWFELICIFKKLSGINIKNMPFLSTSNFSIGIDTFCEFTDICHTARLP